MFDMSPIDLSHGAFAPNGEVNGFNVMMLSALEEEKKKEEEEKKKTHRKVEPVDEVDLRGFEW
jgi:hypothetical protein